MKYLNILFIAIIISGCTKSKQEVVDSYFESLSNRDTFALVNCLSPNFKIEYPDTILDLSQFINYQKDDFFHEKRFDIVNSSDEDSVVKVKFNFITPLDSALGVKSKIEVDAKFYISENKIDEIIYRPNPDTQKENNDEFVKYFYALKCYLYDNQIFDSTINDDKSKLKKFYITNSKKFNNLDEKVRNDYYKTSFLRGVYRCENCIYRKIEFLGKSTCMILGFFGTSYVVDDNFIRIKTDKGDLILRIIDKNTLEGEGWASGLYKKM